MAERVHGRAWTLMAGLQAQRLQRHRPAVDRRAVARDVWQSRPFHERRLHRVNNTEESRRTNSESTLFCEEGAGSLERDASVAPVRHRRRHRLGHQLATRSSCCGRPSTAPADTDHVRDRAAGKREDKHEDGGVHDEILRAMQSQCQFRRWNATVVFAALFRTRQSRSHSVARIYPGLRGQSRVMTECGHNCAPFGRQRCHPYGESVYSVQGARMSLSRVTPTRRQHVRSGSF